MVSLINHQEAVTCRNQERDDLMGIVILEVTPDIVAKAQEIREERDRHYPNIYEERDTDLRWGGEVGELCFGRWVWEQTDVRVRWILDTTAGKPDFLLGNTAVGIKTVKRKGETMRAGWTAQITARHAQEPVDYFFFTCYFFEHQKLWLLGGMKKEAFVAQAKRYKEGEKVHNDYVIRPGHEILNIEVVKLTEPGEWIKSLNL